MSETDFEEGFSKEEYGITHAEMEAMGERKVRENLNRGNYGLPNDKVHIYVSAWLADKEFVRAEARENEILSLAKAANEESRKANEEAREANRIALNAFKLERRSERAAWIAAIAAIIAAIAAISDNFIPSSSPNINPMQADSASKNGQPKIKP